MCDMIDWRVGMQEAHGWIREQTRASCRLRDAARQRGVLARRTSLRGDNYTENPRASSLTLCCHLKINRFCMNRLYDKILIHLVLVQVVAHAHEPLLVLGGRRRAA